ncbi:tetratricopeptide repeat protein [Streptomyces sp. SCUT-3]|uniref:tetratricopeptide repeat protein n=1 Tax=Streptomyces sp. SCUT-3 TaxID=2684469 RepID=UPI0015FB6935|nr:tetratricopeptide repeat protein [Streptomyces sp. SCUT-3]
MTGRDPSWQEPLRWRGGGFVGRREEIAAFEEALRRSPEGAGPVLFRVHGPAGAGKTALLRRMESAARQARAATVYVDGPVADAVGAMAAVGTQLAQQGLPLKGFEERLAVYRRLRQEPVAGVFGTGADRAAVTVPGASGVGLPGPRLTPGTGAFVRAADAEQVVAWVDRVKARFGSRLRSYEDVRLVLSPLQVLTPVFLDELAEAVRGRPWTVWFFDAGDRHAGPVPGTWLHDVLVTGRYGRPPANVLAVTAGRSRPDAQRRDDRTGPVVDLPLEVLTETEVRELSAAAGITGERAVEAVLELSGRLPVLVSTLVAGCPAAPATTDRPADPAADGRPSGPARVADPGRATVEQFLAREADPVRHAAVLACALPREWDEDVYRAAVAEEAAPLFDRLRRLPFVTGRAGRHRYHEVVRTAVLRLHREQSPDLWREQHTRLADAFRQWRERLEDSTAPDGGRWQDERLLGHRLEETYHRLCADPRAALPRALRELPDAYDHGTPTLRRWAEALLQAGRDADAPAVSDRGRQVLAALEDPLPGVAALTLLLDGDALDTPGRALAHLLRARDRRNAGHYEQALADYRAAVALAPEARRAHHGRGVAHVLVGRYDDALADFERVLDLAPDDARALADRAEIHRQAHRYDEASADYDRAVDLAPDDAWILAGRGQARQAAGRHDDALADFDRALELDPGDLWSLADRAETYRLAGRHDDALADYDRAVELDPRNARAAAGRGETHRLAGRYDAALADFDRAVELDPHDAWALANRGQVHQAMGRYDAALADFDLAVELDPYDLWALVNRAETHRIAGRYDAALADYDLAVETDPYDAWAAAGRAETHRLAGRYDAALADFDNALELDPDDAWALAGRGRTHRATGRYDAALADARRVVAADPDDGWSHYEEGLTLRAMARPGWEQCLARAVERFARDAAGAGPGPATGEAVPGEAATGEGGLFVAHCALSSWEEADRHLTRFLAAAPHRGQVGEVLADLDALAQAIASATEHLRPFRHRLEDALAALP